MRLPYWLPPVLWMAFILSMSSNSFSGTETGRLIMPGLHWLLPWLSETQIALIHLGTRKLAHLADYAVLALLWQRALVQGRGLPPRAAAVLAFLIAAAWGGVDESFQLLMPARTSSVTDAAIDSLGAAAGLTIAQLRRLAPRAPSHRAPAA